MLMFRLGLGYAISVLGREFETRLGRQDQAMLY